MHFNMREFGPSGPIDISMAQSDKSLGNRVRQLRKSRGWSQEQLASIAGGERRSNDDFPHREPLGIRAGRVHGGAHCSCTRRAGGCSSAGRSARSGASPPTRRESASAKWMALEETSISDALRHIQRRVRDMEEARNTRRPAKRKKAR